LVKEDKIKGIYVNDCTELYVDSENQMKQIII